MTTKIFQKFENGWKADEATVFYNTDAGTVAKYMREKHPEFQIGFRASDLGPAVMAVCVQQGYGNVLWMK